MPRQYPREFRERAVRLVTESRDDHETEWSAIKTSGDTVGCWSRNPAQMVAPG
jgi:transposase